MIGEKPRALCANSEYDPEWWFPEAANNAMKRYDQLQKNKETIAHAIIAMQVCQECPLFKNNWCLSYAMTDASMIDYGIYATTLPKERREATGLKLNVYYNSELFIDIRNSARRAGILDVRVNKQERPTSRWSGSNLPKPLSPELSPE